MEHRRYHTPGIGLCSQTHDLGLERSDWRPRKDLCLHLVWAEGQEASAGVLCKDSVLGKPPSEFKTHLPTRSDRVAPELTAKPETPRSRASGSSEGSGLAGWVSMGISWAQSGEARGLGERREAMQEQKNFRIRSSGLPFPLQLQGKPDGTSLK